ncbi:uncharacterized protein LOC119669180 [Teleopsis dalmanni]|uniref:uncharacterized protein LOC119669180 n=1 Tax=Teleopsis dalmanni TaxID=139649 RepID=UPI0018CE408C|nr:uncharacterized protein LOC119669180 [Teleopsis dalmanni]
MGDNNNEDICMICLEIKTNPKTLRCKHSFCHGCITQLTMHSKFYLYGPKCPLCRSTLEDKPQQSAAGGSNRHSVSPTTNLTHVNARVRNSHICVERAVRELRRVWYDIISSDSDEDDTNIRMPRRRAVDVTTHTPGHGRSYSTAQFQNVQQETDTDLSINNDSSSSNQLQDLNNLVENVQVGRETMNGILDELQIAQDLAAQGTSHGRSLSTAQFNYNQQPQIDLTVNCSSLKQLQKVNILTKTFKKVGDTWINIKNETKTLVLDEIVRDALETSQSGSLSTAQLNNVQQQLQINFTGDNVSNHNDNNITNGTNIFSETMHVAGNTTNIEQTTQDFRSIENENLHLNNETTNSAVLEVELITDVNTNGELDEVQVVNANEELDEVQVVNANAVLEVELITDVNADGELDEVQVVNANPELDEVQVVNAEELNENSSTNNEEKI